MKNSVDGAKFKPQRKNARGRHRTDELCSHDSNEVDKMCSDSSNDTYGYLKSKTEKNRIVVDEATAGNVRLIYKLFLEGKGYTPIAKYLNEQGIMSPLMYLKSLGYQQNVKTNGVWTKTTVKSILTNQAYIGSAVHGKVVIEKEEQKFLKLKVRRRAKS